MSEWIWLTSEDVEAIHAEQLALHGGPAGTRDSGLLESALAPPLNPVAYGDPDLASLAAAYAFGVARNHPFIDGNKRAAWILARLFVRLNGGTLSYEGDDAYRTMMALAAGDLSEGAFAEWIRERLGEIS